MHWNAWINGMRGDCRLSVFAAGCSVRAVSLLLFFFVFLLSLKPVAVVAQFRELPMQTERAADDSLAATEDADESLMAGERLLWLSGAALTYSLFDYIGFNMARTDDATLRLYRVIQVLVQAGITWLLYEQAGLPTALSFNVMWWTWGMDALYYVYTDMFDAQGHWERRGSFERFILGNRCTWASWTPIGMLRGMDKSKPIAGDTLIAQMLVGAALGFTITLTF